MATREVQLDWTPALTVGPLFEQYQIWRAQDDADFELLDTLDVVFGGSNRFDVTEPEQFFDTVETGHTYRYFIRAIGADRSNTGTIDSSIITIEDVQESFRRLTESGAFRVTEDDAQRILE